uniref:Aha1_N domain-containing protein n=1 Tax=Syphacia muris TaxID=451379 RepID=A0A0N5APF0_9BILA
MAKWGEGDPRWIVEERPDAVNVNNWHWTEKNATPWSKQRLNELLTNQKVEDGAIVATFTKIRKIEGEATANNRKAKLIFLFEWIIELEFETRVAGSSVTYEGYVEIPNLSDENEANEIQVDLHIEKSGPKEIEVRHFFKTHVTSFIRKQIEIYLRELKEEFSKGLILPTDKTRPQVIVKGKTNIGNSKVNKKIFQDHVEPSNSSMPGDASPSPVGAVESFTITENYKVQPDNLWEVFTNPEFIKKWSNSGVKFDLRVGGEFSLFNDMVSGRFLRVELNKELETAWRLKKYPLGHYANIRFIFKDEKDSTELTLIASDVPALLKDETENGLRHFYLESISHTFGFGARIF